MKKLLPLVFLATIFCSLSLKAQSLEGTWKTIDDETNKEKSYVKIYKTQSGKYAGKVIKILREERQDATCEKCSDYRKDQPVLNMVIVTGMSESGEEWKGGKILDPEKGKEYSCKMWLENSNTLKVRGYLGPFFRTQTWYRMN